jgi:membrane protein
MTIEPSAEPEAEAPWRHPWVRALWNRAYKENITGLAGMVAYNLMLAIFPFALLVLFVFGQIVNSNEIEQSVILDIQRLFPNIEQTGLEKAIDRVRDSSTTIGLAAVIGGIWIGASFWGAMDTAFCRIYHVECRSWVAQKRFALVMLVALTLLLAASVAVPIVESAALAGASDLPWGLGDLGALRIAVVVIGGFVVTFAVVCAVYWAVPKGHMPWRSVWPGALFFATAVSIANYVFPLYLTSISNLSRVGGAIGFVLVALIWFYAVSLGLLVGAVINSLRHELDETGTLPTEG